MHTLGGPGVFGMQIDGKLLPDRFTLQRHRRLEHRGPRHGPESIPVRTDNFGPGVYSLQSTIRDFGAATGVTTYLSSLSPTA